MMRDLDKIKNIQTQKANDIAKKDQHALDPEGKRFAEHKRFTFDIIGVPVDPLR